MMDKTLQPTKSLRRKYKTIPQSHINSPYHIYLNSLAVSGRSAMKTQLDLCAQLLGHAGSAESYQWHTMTFEKVHLIRSTMVDMGYAVNSINFSLAGLRGVAKAAFNLGKMDADNMLRINAVKSVKGNAVRTGRRLSSSEIKKLITACKELPNDALKARERALLLIGVGGGLRCAEICSLNLCDIDLEQGLLKVIEGKGRKQRQIYLAMGVLSALKTWVKHRGEISGALFTRILKGGQCTQKRLSQSGVAHILGTVQERADVTRFTPHDMRRTFITQLLESGIDLNTVRQLAGHSDVSTTVAYDKRDLAWQKEASQGIDL